MTLPRYGLVLQSCPYRAMVDAPRESHIGEQQWAGSGVVRAIYPQLLVITHEEIRGLLPARTTSFRTSSPTLRDSIRVGDAIRFSLGATLADDVAVVAIERW